MRLSSVVKKDVLRPDNMLLLMHYRCPGVRNTYGCMRAPAVLSSTSQTVPFWSDWMLLKRSWR